MEQSLEEFRNQNIVVTGGSRGIGKRIAMAFAATGARIGLVARSKAELDLAKLEIEHAGGTALHLRADVRDADQIRGAIDRARAHWGEIDALICAAGIQGPIGPLAETAPQSWAEPVLTNLIGVVNTCAAALPGMMRRRRGKVIVLGGGGGAHARPNFSAYAASKAAVIRTVECMAAELLDYNVQVNVLGPGGAYTHMTDEILRAGEKAGEREIADATQIRLTGGVTVQRQTELAMFLASQRSNHVSGKLVHVKDRWEQLAEMTVHPELYTLRRVLKVSRK
ncbi:MAG: SDR family oxidoreductase [Bryobacteraceae bacterium]